MHNVQVELGEIRFAWQFATSGTKRQLAPPWSSGMTVLQFDAVSRDGAICVCLVAGGGTSTVPPTGSTDGSGVVGKTGKQAAAGADGYLWKCYSQDGGCKFSVIDDDASNKIKIGDIDAQLVPVPPNDGSATYVADPVNWYAVASGGTPTLVVVASS